MTVYQVDVALDDRYRQLLDRRSADLFHSPAWAQVLADTYNLSIKAVMGDDAQGQPQGALLYCRIHDALGDRIVSLPFSDYCDPLVDTAEQFVAMAQPLLAMDVPVTIRCVHNSIVADASRVDVVKQARWHGIDLTADAEKLWKGLAEPKRRAVAKARREGVTLGEVSDDEFLQVFHRMHVAMRKQKYRLLAQPMRFFESICRRFSQLESWFPLVAKHNGRPIAAMICLRYDNTLYYKFGTSSRETLPLRPNEFLMWEAIQLAKSLGCTRLDLGLSDNDQPGLVRFKQQLGAREKQIRFLGLGSIARSDAHTIQLKQQLGELTQLLTEPSVPDDITRQAGALLYPLFA